MNACQFGSTESLLTLAGQVGEAGSSELRATPPDPHPVLRVAIQIFRVSAYFTSVGLVAYGATVGSLFLLLEGRVKHICVGIGGGVLLWKLASKSHSVEGRVCGPLYDTTVFYLMQKIGDLSEADVCLAPKFMSEINRSLNRLAGNPVPPKFSKMELLVDEIARIGGNAPKKHHSILACFIVKARGFILLNYLRQVMCNGPKLDAEIKLALCDADERAQRVCSRAKAVLSAARDCKVRLSTDEQRFLSVFQEDKYIRGLSGTNQQIASLQIPSGVDQHQVDYLFAVEMAKKLRQMSIL